MTIAELFVNLGIKGDGSVKKGLDGVKTGLGEVKSMSLEAKAAIISVVYGLEKLMSQSASQGTSLLNFATLTGMSAKTLQQWQYAARQAAVDGDELESSMRGVQKTMMTMATGGGAPAGLSEIARVVGGLRTDKFQDTEYMMKKLAEYAQLEKNPAFRNQMLDSMGISDNVKAAMARGMFTQKNLNAAPVYSKNEVGQLNKVDVAWRNLGDKIQKGIGHFTAQHGLEMVKGISLITDKVLTLANAFMKLADQLQFFKGISKVFEVITKALEGWSVILGLLNSSVDNISKDKGGMLAGATKEGKGFMSNIFDALRGFNMTMEESNNENPANKPTGESILPKKMTTPQNSSQNDITVNQNLNFQHEGKDAAKTADSVKQASDAFWQSSGLLRAN